MTERGYTTAMVTTCIKNAKHGHFHKHDDCSRQKLVIMHLLDFFLTAHILTKTSHMPNMASPGWKRVTSGPTHTTSPATSKPEGKRQCGKEVEEGGGIW